MFSHAKYFYTNRLHLRLQYKVLQFTNSLAEPEQSLSPPYCAVFAGWLISPTGLLPGHWRLRYLVPVSQMYVHVDQLSHNVHVTATKIIGIHYSNSTHHVGVRILLALLLYNQWSSAYTFLIPQGILHVYFCATTVCFISIQICRIKKFTILCRGKLKCWTTRCQHTLATTFNLSPIDQMSIENT